MNHPLIPDSRRSVIRTSVEDSLKRLQTDHIDLLFLHQPTDNWREGYRQIEKAYKEGKVNAIGPADGA